MTAKVLLIDDNDVFRKAISDTLEIMNYEVTPLTDGKNVVQYLKTTRFDIIITDIIMPDKDGFETINDIRKYDQTIPIIAVTGDGAYEQNQNLKIAEKLGATDTIMKPFETSALVEKINNLLQMNH
jgi:DNA-binding response OmpR family regulator